MNRKDFLKRVGLLGVAGVVAPKVRRDEFEKNAIQLQWPKG